MATLREQLESLRENNAALIQTPQETPDVQTTDTQPAPRTTEGIISDPSGVIPPAPEAIASASKSQEAAQAVPAELSGLEALRQRNEQVMQENGDPPVDPATVPKDVGVVMSYLGGFNREFSKAVDFANKAMNPGGIYSEDILNDVKKLFGFGVINPDAITPDTARQLQDLGVTVNTGEVKNLSDKIGAESFKGFLTLSSLMAAAPTLAAKAGVSTKDFIIREFGKILQKNPGLQIIAQQGASAGAEIGQEYFGDAGAVPGALIGSWGADIAGRAGKATLKGVDALAMRSMRGLGIAEAETVAPGTTKPIRDPNINPQVAREFSEQQLEGYKKQMDQALDRAVADVPTKGTPQEMQVEFYDKLARAEKIGRRIESEFWDKVDMKRPVPTERLLKQFDRYETQVNQTPYTAPPDKLMERVRNVLDGERTPSIKQIRDLVAETRYNRLTEDAKSKFGYSNAGLIRNYVRLEGMLIQGIAEQYPKDVAMRQARNMSIKYNDLFSRGPLADIMATKARGDEVVPPGQSVEKLMGQFEGTKALTEMEKQLSRVKRVPGQDNAYPTAATPPEKFDLQATVNAAEDSVRSMFREVADTMGPEAGAKFIAKNQASIRPLARVSVELDKTAEVLNGLASSKEALGKSALARFTQNENADKAIGKVWAAAKPQSANRELINVVSKDANALAGYRAGMVDKLFLEAKGDPVRAAQLLGSVRVQELMRDALDPAQFARLHKIVDVARGLAQGDEKLLRHMFFPTASILARIVGAQVGRNISHVFGGGTVQTPGIVSNAFRRSTEKLFRASSPQTLMRNAVLDTGWEKLLLSREPGSIKQARVTQKAMRRIIGTIEGERQRQEAIYAGDE